MEEIRKTDPVSPSPNIGDLQKVKTKGTKKSLKLPMQVQGLLRVVRANGIPAWETLPSMADALTAFQRNQRSVLVQVNGLVLFGDMITSTGSWRCLTVAQALASGQIPWEATIITTGGKGAGTRTEAEVFKKEILNFLEDFGEPLPSERIHEEGDAKHTIDNAERSAIIVEGLVEKHRDDPRTGIPPPYLLFIATTDWHFERQFLTHTILPEVSEFSRWRKKFPGLEIRPLKSPYPPWNSRNLQTRWLARAHVATHFFAPLQTNLWSIARGQLKNEEGEQELREEAVVVFGAALAELSMLEDTRPQTGPRSHFVEATWAELSAKKFWTALCDLYCLMDSKKGMIPPFAEDSAAQQEWTGYAKHLRDITEKIRYISDPDRR